VRAGHPVLTERGGRIQCIGDGVRFLNLCCGSGGASRCTCHHYGLRRIESGGDKRMLDDRNYWYRIWYWIIKLTKPERRVLPGLAIADRQEKSVAVSAAASTAATAATAATASTVATATASTTATAASTTAISATTASAAVFLRAGFVDGEGAAHVFLAVQRVDCRLSFFIRSHFHKPKPFASACLAVVDHLCRRDIAVLSEQLLEIRVRTLVAQISDIKLLTHRSISYVWVDLRPIALTRGSSRAKNEKEVDPATDAGEMRRREEQTRTATKAILRTFLQADPPPTPVKAYRRRPALKRKKSRPSFLADYEHG